MSHTDDSPVDYVQRKSGNADPPLDIVLVEPEIPGNTGSTARTCAAIGASLHLVHPLGFDTDEAAVRRAGLDYWHLVDIHHYSGIDELKPLFRRRTCLFASTKGRRIYSEVDMTGPCALVFGKETAGLSDEILSRYSKSVYRIPIKRKARSLNLSNAVAVIAFECMRQRAFAGLEAAGRGI